jgi:predicted transcriptional regulator of viral defense system
VYGKDKWYNEFVFLFIIIFVKKTKQSRVNFMQFQPFYKIVKEIRPIFTLNDLRVIFSDQPISSGQLTRWQENGYIIKLKNGVYLLEDFKQVTHHFLIANLLYQPSYVSLETALYEYGFIPDVTQTITSVSAKKTWSTNALGHNFIYKKIKTECFIGYGARKYQNYNVLMAEPEKALIDFLYFNKSRLKKDHQIGELRFNYENLKQKIDKETLRHYAMLFNSPALSGLLEKIILKF